MERLLQHDSHPLVVLLGQAAQGKSTLAASLVRSSSLASVWINVQEEDEDPINLFRAIVQGLSLHLDASSVDFLNRYTDFQLGPRFPEPLYRDWINAIFSNVLTTLRIVFDGLDRLSDDAASFLFLRLMLQEAPSHIKFLLISRSEPPLPLQDWRIKQRAYLLQNEDLAFTYAETKSFLQEHCGLSCGRDEVQTIWQTTEGWAGGLVLLSQLLQNAESSDTELRRIASQPDRFQSELFHYFAQEIFTGLSEPEAAVLLHSSIFKEIDPRILNELLAITDSEEILEDLARRNLFVNAPFVSSSGWIYRFHQLFRDFLQKMWLRKVDSQQRRRFLFRTGKACARRKDLEAAVDFFLQAGELRRAASSLKLLGRRMIHKRRHKDLEELLQRFPERIVQARPWLLLYRAWCRRYSHAAENLHDLQKAELIFRTGRDHRGHLLALAYLMEAVMFLGRDAISLHSLLERGEALLSALGFSKHPLEQSLLWLQMGFCYALRGEDTRDGYRASQNAYYLAKKMHDHPLQIRALIHSMIPLTFLGEFQEGDKLRSQVESMLSKRSCPELEAIFFKVWSELILFGGRLEPDLAESLIERLNEKIERLGLLYLQAPAMYSELACHMYAGREEKAEDIGQRLQDMADAMNNVFGKGLGFILQGLLAYRQRRWDRARELLEAGLGIFRHPEMRSPLHDYEFSIGAGLVYMHLESWQKAETLLNRSLHYFTNISSQLARTEATLSLALLHEKQGHRKEALKHLESGLFIAAAKEFTHFVVLSPQDQLSVCLLALEAGTVPAQKYAARLLQTGLTEAVAADKTLQSHLHPRVRRTVNEVMLGRHRGGRPRLDIRTLGRFLVLVDGEPLPESAWQGNQTKHLLKALVAFGLESQARKELLIEELWPESSPEAGEKTFKVALHRLRRALEPDLCPEFGSSYVHLKSGRVFLDRELCQIDAERFVKLCRRAEAGCRSSSEREALALCREAASIYQGSFLANDPETGWAREVRERLQNKYIGLLMEMARIWERSGSWTKAVRSYELALECDPLQEELYRRLMAIYAEHGRRNKAMQIYERCCSVLRRSLDVEPEEQTIFLYRSLFA